MIDGLLNRFKKAGLMLVAGRPGELKDLLEVDGVRFRLRLTEKLTRTEHKETREERLRAAREVWFRVPRWDYTGTGNLVFWALEVGRSWNLSWNWKESTSSRLDKEPSHEAIVRALRDLAIRVKEGIEHDRRRAEEWERQRRAEEELRERARRERERVGWLRQEAGAWREAETLRSYVAAVVSRLEDTVDASSLGDWMASATRVAVNLNPVENGDARRWFSNE